MLKNILIFKSATYFYHYQKVVLEGNSFLQKYAIFRAFFYSFYFFSSSSDTYKLAEKVFVNKIVMFYVITDIMEEF